MRLLDFFDRASDRLDRWSRSAYISLVLVAAVALTTIGVLVLYNTRRIEDQQDTLEQQIERTRRALVYTCETTTVVRLLAQTTLVLLKSQPRTPARLQTIATFEQLLIPLQNNEACLEIQENP